METWQTHHEHDHNEEWTLTVTWRWSARDHKGRKLPKGQYRAKPLTLQFSMFVPASEQTLISDWLSEV